MSNKPVPRVRVPANAKKDELIEIKTLISHEMESGQRKDSAGATIPRRIINTFNASFNGKTVFRGDLAPRHLRKPLPVVLLQGGGER